MPLELVDRCDFKPGDVVDGKYSIRKSLGEGSFGVVYLVDDLTNHQPRALKLLRLWDVPSEIRRPLKERFKMEFETGQIASENLVQSFSYGYVVGNPYIVMEFCSGGDLTPFLGKKDVDVVEICRDILCGLDALHQRGKVHRDLKPENVLIKENHMAALTDFGIVGDSRHRLTHIGFFGRPDQIFGTYAYMAPEQANRARGGATVLPTSDVFSFGVLAYQLLTGELPFGPLESHNDLGNYLKRGKKGVWKSESLLQIPDGHYWERLIGACLQPDYRQRLQCANDVVSYLPAVAKGSRSSKKSGYGRCNDRLVDERVYTPREITRGLSLRVLQGEEYGRSYDLTNSLRLNRSPLTVGRGRENAVCIKSDFSEYISRRQCTIVPDVSGHQWLIRDGQWNENEQCWHASRNGTFVNSHPVGASGYYLSLGDIITLGDVTLRFENY